MFLYVAVLFFFFFFQAEDGIRDLYVTGVQTCALPISGLVVATTRPETMLGDVAVAVNPKDARYAKLLGKRVRLPLTERVIPVIADDYVDPEFGTGCVKITPAHDFNDYAVGQRHKLPQVVVMGLNAKMNENAPRAYRDLDRFEARKRIVADLKAQKLLVAEK